MPAFKIRDVNFVDARWVPRREARRQIVQAANRHRTRLHAGRPYQPALFSARHIQQAVCVARRNGLVSPELLRAAGYRERAR